MCTKTKKIWSTSLAVLAPIGLFFGHIVDAPEVILKLLISGPKWLSNPDTIWVAGILLIEGCIIIWIWRQPNREPGDADGIRDRREMICDPYYYPRCLYAAAVERMKRSKSD